jgi:hypothetical protein
MHALKTIPDRGAVVAWSPLPGNPNILAAGTKEGGGGGFEEYGGDLTLYAVDLSAGTQQCAVLGRCVHCHPETRGGRAMPWDGRPARAPPPLPAPPRRRLAGTVVRARRSPLGGHAHRAARAARPLFLSPPPPPFTPPSLPPLHPPTHTYLPPPPLPRSVKTATRFTSLAWGQESLKSTTPGAYPQGLLVGGLSDGTIAVWDAAAVMRGEGDAALLALVEHTHTAAVRSLQFNPNAHHAHLIAAGSADCTISIVDLLNPTAPVIATCVARKPRPSSPPRSRAHAHQHAPPLPLPPPPPSTGRSSRTARWRRSWTTR